MTRDKGGEPVKIMMDNIPHGGRAALFINGEMPPAPLVRTFTAGDPLLICADGGANALPPIGLRPDIIIGDLDSIRPRLLEKCRREGTRIIRLRRQSDTDLEKALLFLLENGMRDVILFGATGRSIDHTLGNFSILRRFVSRMRIRLVDADWVIEPIRKEIRFPARPGARISLLPFPSAGGITTRGLLYPLRNESLAFGLREGTCNRATAREVRITLKHGAMLLFRPVGDYDER